MPSDFYDFLEESERNIPIEDKWRLYFLRKKEGSFQKDFAKERENKIKEIKDEFLTLIRDDKIGMATEVIVKYILDNNHIYTTKDDLKSEVWIYRGGIYIPQGRSEIKTIMREILGNWYNVFYYNQVISKLEPDTFIEPELFFSVNNYNEIALENGILNIDTRELKSFSPNKIFFSKIPVKYNSSSKCTSIDCFLNDVLASEDDKKVFYEIGGFALMPEYVFEKAFMFVGSGRNGKGKTIELLKRFFGIENCAGVPLANLESNSFQISELFGKRLNLAGDIGNADLKETGTFKALTGRDLVSGKRKFLRDINFVNNAKFVFACNDLPMVYDLSEGFWSRWILFNFPYTFKDKEEFNNLKDKLYVKVKDPFIIDKIVSSEELSGLLNQFLDGYDRLKQNNGFSSSKGTEEIKNYWIRKANSFMAFAMDKLVDDVESHISKKELRKRYSNYCKEHKLLGKSDIVIKRVLQEMFGTNDEKINVGQYPNNEQIWVWQGVKWK